MSAFACRKAMKHHDLKLPLHLSAPRALAGYQSAWQRPSCHADSPKCRGKTPFGGCLPLGWASVLASGPACLGISPCVASNVATRRLQQHKNKRRRFPHLVDVSHGRARFKVPLDLRLHPPIVLLDLLVPAVAVETARVELVDDLHRVALPLQTGEHVSAPRNVVGINAGADSKKTFRQRLDRSTYWHS